MKGLAYVRTTKGWSIARYLPNDFEWWCGSHDWVSPASDYWHLRAECWNVTFPTLEAARAFATAKARRWE